ncbi:MAG: phenylalanine--tRNA ligase subunit beta, partial [Thermodesulfobacteriota bacterium]
MLVSFNWLKEFVEIDRPAHEIAEMLSMSGIEVESITHVGEGLGKILTARVDEILPHPSADTLHLANISLGDRSERVVCGAPNLKVGQIVPYAPPGASLPSGLEIAAREIRGVLSPGMICSESELGLGDDKSGILELDSSAVPGLPLTTALPFIHDYILE